MFIGYSTVLNETTIELHGKQTSVQSFDNRTELFKSVCLCNCRQAVVLTAHSGTSTVKTRVVRASHFGYPYSTEGSNIASKKLGFKGVRITQKSKLNMICIKLYQKKF